MNIESLVHKLELLDLTNERVIFKFKRQLIYPGLELSNQHNEEHNILCNCNEYRRKLDLYSKIIYNTLIDALVDL